MADGLWVVDVLLRVGVRAGCSSRGAELAWEEADLVVLISSRVHLACSLS